MSRAGISTFLQLPTTSEILKNLCSTMSWLQEFYIATSSFFTCNFYQVELLRKMKKRDLKNMLENYFSIVPFSLITDSN